MRVTFEGSIGTLRSLLARPATPELWFEIIHLVDAMEGEEFEETIAYLEEPLKRWRPRDEHPWLHLSPEVLGEHGFLFMDLLEREVCVAPSRWLYSIFSKTPTPRLALVASAQLGHFKRSINATTALLGLTKERARNLRSLHMGMHTKYSPTFYKKLAKAPGTRSLKRLSMATFSEKHLAALDVEGHISLDHFCVHRHNTGAGATMGDASVFARLFDSSWMQGVHTLTLEASVWSVGEALRQNPSLLPDLHTVEMHGAFEQLKYDLEQVPSCETLRLIDLYTLPDKRDITGAFAIALDGVRRLDLSLWLPLTFPDDPDDTYRVDRFEEIKRHVAHYLPGSAILVNVEEVTLGHWWEESLVARLEASGVRVSPRPDALTV